MAARESQMVDLGTSAPNFKLLDTISNKKVTLKEFASDKATVILFICNHCPFVHHINKALVFLALAYQKKGIRFIAISSNDVINYPEDSPELMTLFAKQNNYPFPYLYDEDQSIAKAYNAECTPDIFVYDKDLKLAYRGRFDATRPNIGLATGIDLSNALNDILETGTYKEQQHPSIGCGIKWKL